MNAKHLVRATILLATWGTAQAALAVGPADVGRAHAKKANQLATAGKCKQAIPEFTFAYEALSDPAILFNRAECFRKLARNMEAAADYEKFLVDMPRAPNRASVEARIAELRAAIAAPASAPPAPVPPPPPPPPPVLPAADLSAAAAPASGPAAPPPAAVPPASPPPKKEKKDETPKPAEPLEIPKFGELSPSDSAVGPAPPAAGPSLGPAHATDSTSADAALRLGDAPPPDEPFLSRVPAWGWVALAVVIAAGGAAGYYFARKDPTKAPPTNLGNFKF